MNIVATELPGVLLFVPTIRGDDRGFFFESFNQRNFEEATGECGRFVQDNHSRSQKGVLRGLHLQLAPKAQGKLVRVASGSIYDVAVDVRPSSRSFGKWVGVTLTAENHHQLWIPEGFAHGFLTLSDSAEVLYKATDFWAPEFERSIAWNDPEIAIRWPLSCSPILSPKDMNAITLANFLSSQQVHQNRAA